MKNLLNKLETIAEYSFLVINFSESVDKVQQLAL